MVDKVFPDDLLNLILDSAFQRHGVEVDKVKPNPSNVEILRTTSLELIGRVDEFLKRSKVEETVEKNVETKKIEQATESVESEQIEQVKEQIEVASRNARRSFWGHL